MGDNLEQKSTEIKTEKKKPGPKPKAAKEAEVLKAAGEAEKAVAEQTSEDNIQVSIDDTDLADSKDTVALDEVKDEKAESESIDAQTLLAIEEKLDEFDVSDVPEIRTCSTGIKYSSVVPFIFYRGPHDSLGDGYATDISLTGEVIDGFAKCDLLAPNWIVCSGYVKLNNEIKHLLGI